MRRNRDRIGSSLKKNLTFLLVFSLISFIQNALAETRGVLEVPETTFNFGEVHEGTIVKHDFILKNTGTAELAVQRVVAACGCTATSTSANTIAAGGTVTVSAQFDTNGFSGKRDKLIRVYTSDLDKPMETLTLSGEIISDTTVEPSNIMFEALEPNSTEIARTKDFTVDLRSGANLTFDSSETFSKYLTISEKPINSTRRSFKILVSADTPPGDLRSRVVVHLKDSSGKDRALIVPVFASVKKSIRFVPATISFGLIPPDKSVERTVKLENVAPQPLSIKSVTSSNPAVTAELVEVNPGKDFNLKIKVDPAKLEKELNASVDLTTNSVEQPTLSLTLLGFKAQAASEQKG